MTLLRWLAASLLLASIRVDAAPPLGGFRPIEEVVAGACHVAETVAVARVARVVVEPMPDGEARVATIEVVRVIRGRAADVPATRTFWIQNPPPTDSFPTRVQAGAELVFFVSRKDAGFQAIQPTGPYAHVPVDRVVALAESVCQAPETPRDR